MQSDAEEDDVRDLWIALVDRLVEERRRSHPGNAEQFVGAALAKDFSDLRRSRQTQRTLTPRLHAELKASVARNAAYYNIEVADEEWARLDRALSRHRTVVDQAKHARARSAPRLLLPSEAWSVLLRRAGEAQLDARQLADPLAARRFIEAATLERMRAGRYDLAQSAANALIVACDMRYEGFRRVHEEARSETIADAVFYLGLNAFHAGDYDTLAACIRRLEEANASRTSRSIRGNFLHLQNIMRRGIIGAENAREAYEEIIDLPIERSLPPREIIERAITARHINRTFVPSVPLETVVMDDLTVERLLRRNITTALSVGAMDSCAVAHVGLIEAKLKYLALAQDGIYRGKLLEDATFHLQELETHMLVPGALTKNTKRLLDKVRWDVNVLKADARPKKAAP